MGPRSSDLNDPDLLRADPRFEKNHEKLTALALHCLANKNLLDSDLTQSYKVCDFRTVKLSELNEFVKKNKLSPDIGRYMQLIEHVRWPDDPTRLLEGEKSVSDLEKPTKDTASEGFSSCHSRAKEGEYSIAADGLLCNSHYGRLQFLHSMAEKNGELSSTTRSRMDEWIEFAYLVATSKIKVSNNYCAFWKDNEVFPKLSKIMYESSLKDNKLCEDREIWRNFLPFVKTYPAWSVGTIFNLECKGILFSDLCNAYNSDEKVIRLIALGSIIHMIQDSYSNSHTDRGSKKPEAKVICKSIKSFNGYSNQDPVTHAISDKWPSFDSSCDGSGTIDPITATAMAVWHVHNNTPFDKFREFIGGVFGELSVADTRASAGSAYKRN